MLGRVALLERAPDFLLPFDDDLYPDGRLAVPGTERADVDEEVRLRVGGAAAVDRAVALARLERRRLPELLVARGHDVVVAVQEHGRRAGRPGDLAGEHRRRAREIEPSQRRPHALEQRAHRLVRLEDRAVRVLGEPPLGQGRDGDEARELILQLRHQRRHRFAGRALRDHGGTSEETWLTAAYATGCAQVARLYRPRAVGAGP